MAFSAGLGKILLLFLFSYLLCVTSAQNRRSRSRRPNSFGGSNKVNIPFVRATSVSISFDYVQGAKRFIVSVREYVNGRTIGNEASRVELTEHVRSTKLSNLFPGREYIVLVQALDRWGKKVGGRKQKTFRTSQQCYRCNAREDNDQCKGENNQYECPHDKDACLNEIRYSKGVPKITKRCAQWRPELGKRIQNGRDVTRACSGRENIKDVACKCMCRSNLCNEQEMPCLNECFTDLKSNDKISVSCTNKRNVGSVCTWYCVPGYKVQGTSKSTCRRDRTWSVLIPPICVPDKSRRTPVHKCPVLIAPENSFMECTNDNNPNSKCTFTCLSHYILRGSSERVCSSFNSKWSGTPTSCEEIFCNEIEEVNGLSKECTNGQSVGSICDFSCAEGRKFVGSRSLTCLKEGRWSGRVPRCTDPDCSIEPTLFPNVIKECSPIPNRETGKVCLFSCKEGYDLSGPRRSFCYSGNEWTHTSPTCTRVTCRPSATKPRNGFVRCSKGNLYGSKCTFVCEEGFLLRGADSVTCGQQGRWSDRFPTCQMVKCPPIRNFNGLYSCNNGQNFGSVCRLSCRRGFGFLENSATRLECVKKSEEALEAAGRNAFLGQWDNRISRCIAIECPPLGLTPDHSTRRCIPIGYNVGTICTYRCDTGYRMVGLARTVCNAKSDGSAEGEWSNPQPSCQRVECDPLRDVANGAIECTDGVYAGSECDVVCDYGYNLAGQNPVVCTVRGVWSRRFGRCSIVTCTGIPTLKNGRYLCGRVGRVRRFNFNHVCQPRCNTGFKLSIPGTAVCGVRGNWLTEEGLECEDVNECEVLDGNGQQTNGDCQQLCVNTVGSHYCDCEENYMLSADGKTCRITICPELEAIKQGRISCSDSNNIGSRCSLRCIPGFQVSGIALISCSRSGAWTNDFGSCERISCPDIEIPRNGLMECNLGFKYMSECTFECIEGFVLRGRESTSCGADGEWTSAVPRCRRKICDTTFITVSNAKVECTNANRYQSVCTATCDEGYKLDSVSGEINEVSISCLENSTWSSSKPECVKKRCNPSFDELTETRTNGEVQCTNKDFFRSTCLLVCDEGYKVVGEFRIQCVGDAEWNKKLGFCEKVKCPKLRPPSNGRISCTDGYSYLSTCTSTCNKGHDLKGKSETTCQSDRSWTENVPTCEKKRCLDTFLKSLHGSVRCSDDAFFGSTCTYQCDAGYVFSETDNDKQGPSASLIQEANTVSLECSVECVGSGCKAVWSSPKPVCVRHECVPPSRNFRAREKNGNIQCSNGDKFESVCELSCEKGFLVEDGQSSMQCMDDKAWSPKLGLCSRRRCPMFRPILNGGYNCTNANFYESRCRFWCYSGYRMVGISSTVCQANGKFSRNPPPTCRKIICSDKEIELSNGNVTCTDGSRFASECVFVCNPGYEMVYDITQTETLEKVTRICLATRTWSGSLPICRRKKCSVNDGALAKARLHGDVSCTNHIWYGSICSVTCHTGFRLIGPRTTVCQANSDWAPPIGYCDRRTCPPLRAPRFGTIDCTNENKFESVCSFTCNYGYELIGEEKSTCLAMGIFSNNRPFCREILCPSDYLNLNNGEVTCDDQNKLDSRCVYECNEGYKLTDRSAESLVCLDTYKWSEDKPQCEKKTCPQGDQRLIRATEQGTLICSDDNRYQSICSVDCFPGYKITGGGAFTECRSDQKWGPDLGYCIKIECDEFSPLANGDITCTDGYRYLSICSFSCDPGYELTHDRTATCQADRTFSDVAPQCTKITCSRFHLRIFNGKVTCTDSNFFGSICSYGCDLGFERVSGAETAECLADRSWSAQKTGCERIVCNGNDEMFVKARMNGGISCTGDYFFASVCSVTCNTGYELSGVTESRAQCNALSQWDGDLGSCTRVECRDLASPKNGSMTCTAGNVYESTCTFTCDTGYEMSGEGQTTCQSDRKWTNDEPTCDKIECSSENLFLDNGSANCTEENKYLSVCFYQCSAGYEMDEEVPFSMCTATRAWTRNKPTCVKKICDFEEEMITRALENGDITCTDESRYQSICTLECDEGYELIEGFGVIECTETGEWSEKIGICQKIICTELEAPKNGEMECTDDNRFESICTFECDEGYEMEGSPQSECLSNRSFSNQAPDCKITQCPSDHFDIPFGSVKCTDGNNFMSVCLFDCDDGFEMIIDERRSECQSNRTWSIDVPICEKIVCPYDAPHLLKAMEDGTINCTEGNRFQSVCFVECHDGYELYGETYTECTREGTWTNSLGHCEKIECEDLPEDPNGNKFCSDGNFFNSSCTFSCEGGFTFSAPDLLLEEEVTMTCNASQVWTAPGTTPECTEKQCPEDFLEIANGNVTCSDGSSYRSQCLVKCAEGYELAKPVDDFDVTTLIMMCLANSTWDVDEKPVCQRIVCQPDLLKDEIRLAHGKIECTYGANFESTCTLTCNEGYQISGVVDGDETTTKCQSDGAWFPMLGFCTKISCPPLTAPSNSTLQCSDGFKFKSACQVICKPGFEIYNPENDYDEKVGLECKANGEWCGDLPTCTKVRCPKGNMQLDGGAVSCTEDNFFQSQCQYMCNAGYQMIQGQSEMTTCTPHQTWSSPPPTCEKSRCPANDPSFEEARLTGEIVCSEENKFGSDCQLLCAQGFKLTGEPISSCLDTGEWSNGIGLCNKIECDDVKVPGNVEMACSDHKRFESFCTFNCKSGYMLTETSVKAGNGIVCKASGQWEGEIIKCEKISCPSTGFTKIENGQVTCNDTNQFMSRCLFACDGGYELELQINPDDRKSGVVNCTDRGFWDVPSPPKCRPIRCEKGVEELQREITNGVVECSDGARFESKCKVTCLKGFELVGNGEVTCGNDRKWGPTLGSCEKISCQALAVPKNGRMRCDVGFKYMSQCIFDCLPGYRIVLLRNSAEFTRCQADGTWISRPPTCEKQRCDSSYLRLINGKVTCTESNAFNSECEYNCNDGYELVADDTGSRIARCLRNKTWSMEKPRCRAKTCESAVVANGYTTCNGTEFNAVCGLTCELGHSLVGASISTCRDSRRGATEWNPPLGKCEKMQCSVVPEVSNGNMICSDGSKFRSTCYVMCERGYRVNGTTFSTQCRSDGTWSSAFQKCHKVKCDSTYLTVDYGSAEADNENNFGSTIKYSCPSTGYKFTGAKQVTCLENGHWSRPKPKCQKLSCPAIRLPKGRIICNGRRYNDFQSRCQFSCNENFEKIGSDSTECQIDGTWTNPTPYCKGHCDVNLDTLKNGQSECTNSDYHQSKCTFQCNGRPRNAVPFVLYGNDFLKCKANGRWDGTPPCCVPKCQPNAKMDLFFIIHSRENMRYRVWEDITRLANRILSHFRIGRNNVQAGAIRYNRNVDTSSEVVIQRNQNKAALQRAIRALRFGGRGTSTTKVLNYVAQSSIKRTANRPDVSDTVILIMDEKSDTNSDRTLANAVELLKQQNVTIYVIAIKTRTKTVSMDEISKIASAPTKHHVIVIDGYQELSNPRISQAIADRLCKNPCLHDTQYLQQAGGYFRNEKPLESAKLSDFTI